MKFLLIQCDKNGVPTTDMGYEAIQAIKFHEWIRGGISDKDYDWIQIKPDDDITPYLKEDFIPVGTIEFFEDFIYRYKSICPKAINIPKELQTEEFLKRNIRTVKIHNLEKTINLEEDKFVKDNIKIKGASGVTPIIDNLFLMGEREGIIDNIRYYREFLISDMIDIVSEWRVFVHRGKIIDIKQYSGELLKTPNLETIEKMIKTYESSPTSYTMDVAVDSNNNTVILECHNFWSTGLYGFTNGDDILNMIHNAWIYELKKGS